MSNIDCQRINFQTKSITVKISPLSELYWREFIRQYSPSIEIPRNSGRLHDYSRFVTEIYHRLYYEFEPHYFESIAPEHKWAEKLHQMLTINQEFEQLSEQISGNVISAGVASIKIANDLISKLPQPQQSLEDLSRLRSQVKRLKREVSLTPDEDLKKLAKGQIEKLISEGKEKVRVAQEFVESLSQEMISMFLSNQLFSLGDELEALNQQIEMLGIEVPGSRNSTERQIPIGCAIEVAEELQRNKKLQKILELAGKLVKITRIKRRKNNATSTSGELVGVTTGNTLNLLLPSELSRLSHSSFRSLFIKDYIEQSLLQYELQSPESQRRGPIILMADSTGSMNGNRLMFSRALMIALSTLARQDKRDFCILHWGNGVLRVDYFKKSDRGISERLINSIQYYRNDKINNEMAAFQGAVEIIESTSYANADLIFLTDGEWGCGYRGDLYGDSSRWSQEFQRQRQKLQVSVYALLVENDDLDVRKYVQPDEILKITDLFDVNILGDFIGSALP